MFAYVQVLWMPCTFAYELCYWRIFTFSFSIWYFLYSCGNLNSSFNTITSWTQGVGNTLKRHYETYLLEYELAHDDVDGECCLLCHRSIPFRFAFLWCKLSNVSLLAVNGYLTWCFLRSSSSAAGDWVNCGICGEWAHFGCDRRPGLGAFKVLYLPPSPLLSKPF